MAVSDFTPNEQRGRSDLRVRLAPGTELLGQWQSSAYEHAPYIIRRADGQHIQVSQLLYELASSIEAESDLVSLAARVHHRTGRELSADNVHHLLRAKLAPLGVLATDDHPTGPLARPNPLLALRFRVAIVPARAHKWITTTLTFLFWPPIVAASLIALAAADIWLGVTHGGGILTGIKGVIAHPALLLCLVLMSLTAAVIHEIGHATAARAGGATPGVMGAGIYLVWPVFYTDVTDTYRLGRSGRLRTDLGGIYFNALTLLAASGVYAFTRSPLLLVFIAVTHLEVAQQFLPFVRMDGYWVVSDLIGVPNLFAYLAPALARLVGRATPGSSARLAQIRPWARRVIEIWVVATAVLLALNLFVLVWLGPRIVDATLHAAAVRSHHLAADVARPELVTGASDAFSLVFLLIPAVGIVYMSARLLGRGLRSINRLRPERPLVALCCVTALAALIGYQGYAYVSSYSTGTPRPSAAHASATGSPHRPAVPPAAVPPAETTATNHPATAQTPHHRGAWTVQPDGTVTTMGTARLYGSPLDLQLAAPTIAIASTPDGRGYWLAGADGGVFAYGDARFYGSVANIHLDGPVVAITTTPDGHGYWLTATDGGVFAFGDAVFRGSVADRRLAAPVVDIAATTSGHGYWLAAADGGVFALGDATYLGNALRSHAGPTTAITTMAHGYELREGTIVLPYRRGP